LAGPAGLALRSAIALVTGVSGCVAHPAINQPVVATDA
jgi:hypothetical protein